MKRIAIYFFYDADGIVDSYNDLLLQDLSQYCERLVVVCNGKLSPAGRKLFSRYTPDIMVRENKGFDVWAYKTAIEWIGWDSLREYDELVMLNFTNFAPAHPFRQVFERMDQEAVDFWGLSVHHRVEPAPNWFEGSYIPEHLQSHFIAVRREMLRSIEFRAYWEARPEIKDYYQAISRHEAIFTEYFAQRGFCWRAYAETEVQRTGIIYPALYEPELLMDQYQYPFIKRRVFFHPYQRIYSNTFGYPARDVLYYLEEKTDYPVDAIWENIMRTCNQYDVYHAAHLNRVLPSKGPSSLQKREQMPSLAAILYLSSDNCASRYGKYLKNLPQGTAVYLICEKDGFEWQPLLEEYIDAPVEVVYAVAPDQRARAVFSLLSRISTEYDYIATLHFAGKITDDSRREAGYECAEALLAAETYVENIVQEFLDNPRLGILSPPRMYRGLFWSYYGKESRDYLPELRQLADELHVPFENAKPPVSPYYGAFWCRGKAVQRASALWNEKGSNLLANTPNKGAYQFVDCAWSLLMQAAGYYCGTVMCERLAQVEFTNLTYHLSTINRARGSNSLWHLESILRQPSPPPAGNPSPHPNPAPRGYIDGTVDFASIPRGVMVRQTLKKFFPNWLWTILKKLFKEN